MSWSALPLSLLLLLRSPASIVVIALTLLFGATSVFLATLFFGATSVLLATLFVGAPSLLLTALLVFLLLPASLNFPCV